MQPPVEASIQPPIQPPAETPVLPPAETPVQPPAETPVQPPAPPPTPVPATPATGGTPGEIAGAFNYTIAPGDDMSTLSARFGTTPEAIAKASGIPVSQALYDGMTVRVPTTDPAKAEPAQCAMAIPWSEVNGMWAVGTVAPAGPSSS